MPISGLLITLDRDPGRRDAARTALEQHPAIEIGEGKDHRLPIVVDTPTSEEDRAVWEWLHQFPGATFVDVVYIHFDEDEAARQQGMKASGQSDSYASAPDASVPSNARGEP